MDLFIGIVIGIVLSGIIYIAVRAIKKAGTDYRYFSAHEQNEAKKVVYDSLKSNFTLEMTRDECVKLKKKIESRKDTLLAENFDWLIAEVAHRLQGILDIAKERLETEPKLYKLRAFKGIANEEELFDELHRINLGTSTIISYNELESHGEKGEIQWFNKTYEELLLAHLRELLVIARCGTVEDYQKVMKLWHELDDFSSENGKDKIEFVTHHLAREWNEMSVRFKRELDWYDDMLGLDELTDDDYKGIIKDARENHDFLSLRLSLLLTKDDDSFGAILLGIILAEFKTNLDAQYHAIGFKSGENERNVRAVNQ